MSRPTTLPAWLAYLETLHPKAIAMGLDRVQAVHARMGTTLACPVVTVTGTNGKGSTCAMLEAIYRAAGFRVGLYASPHLARYNERIRIDAHDATDDAILTALDAVEDARTAPGGGEAPTPLTYFEFGTLAALWLFARARLDVVILEVGLGGRLDAVNIIDADVAVVTSIDLDHMDYLGPTREDIGREKAGIFRPGRPAICAEPQPPQSLVDHAAAVGAPIAADGSRLRVCRRARAVAVLGAGWQPLRSAASRAARRAPARQCGDRARGGRSHECAIAGERRGGARRIAHRCIARTVSGAAGQARRSCSTSRTTRTPRACWPQRPARWATTRKRAPCSACSPTRTLPASSTP